MPVAMICDITSPDGEHVCSHFMAKVEKRFLSMRGAASCMLLATHSVGLMSRICNRVVWLDQGTVKMDGPTDAVIPAFIDSM